MSKTKYICGEETSTVLFDGLCARACANKEGTVVLRDILLHAWGEVAL